MNGLAATALSRLKRADLLQKKAFIAGEWLAGQGTLPVIDPATGEALVDVANCPVEAVDQAVKAASAAFPAWRGLTPVARGTKLRAWAALMRAHDEDLASLMTAEQGKPYKESLGEIAYAAAFFDWFAAEGERSYGETIPSHLPGSRLSVHMQPIGVTAAITPWNFPSAMITRKAGAALAAGCVMVVKPAPETPLSALALAKLAEEAGIPKGVFQVVTGEAAPLARRLLEHTEVRAFSFTGSTEVGRLLLAQSAQTVKKASLELGGHAPFLLFDDASFDLAVPGCMGAKFATSGQDCLAANRIYVQRGIYDRFVTAFGEATARLKVGHGLEAGVDIGPMTRPSVAEKCRQQIAQALSAGARLVTGGQDSPLGGNFVTPTVLADVTDDMLIAREETFGPVAAILPFDHEDEVVRRANASEMGLAAYVYTSDVARAMRVSDRLEYGMVGVNTPKFTGAPIPFGGWKQSGLGREGSRHGLAEYLESKYVCFGNLAA
jgi:succinate-semialdehyde dehydrogenase/glutarate-semialdehyde dehydrogenase/aspartate-semialdehyde dehydrogenase